jgi:hypothetical protein
VSMRRHQAQSSPARYAPSVPAMYPHARSASEEPAHTERTSEEVAHLEHISEGPSSTEFISEVRTERTSDISVGMEPASKKGRARTERTSGEAAHLCTKTSSPKCKERIGDISARTERVKSQHARSALAHQ